MMDSLTLEKDNKPLVLYPSRTLLSNYPDIQYLIHYPEEVDERAPMARDILGSTYDILGSTYDILGSTMHGREQKEQT